MSASLGNYIGLTDAARGAVRQDDADLRRASARVLPPRDGVRRSTRPRSTRWRRSSSSRASSCAARTGRRPRGQAEAHFTRVVREGRAPDEVPEADAAAGRPRAPAGAHPRGLRALDERGAPAHRPGRREARRRADRPTSTLPRAALDGALLQVGKRQFARLRAAPDRRSERRLDTPSAAAIIARPPRRLHENGNPRDNGEPFDRSLIRPSITSSKGLLRELEAFFVPAVEAPVFENSTACTSRTSRASAREVNEPVSSLRGDFELKLNLNPLATRPSGLTAKGLHGEFDPGSGRTLAARLTHASRARTRASALGKAANG